MSRDLAQPMTMQVFFSFRPLNRVALLLINKKIFHRWKGENVSANEVEELVGKAVGKLDVTVYGVEVGNLEGRAGMATIVDPEGQLDLDALAPKIDKCLPSYARPLFIRVAEKVNYNKVVFRIDLLK